MRKILFAIFILALGSAAYGQIAGVGGGSAPKGPSFGRWQNDFGMGLMGGTGAGGGPIGGCNGVVDLSAGCALPMLHGAP